MYRSLPQLVEGWSKNVYLGGRRSFPGRAGAPGAGAGDAGGARSLFWLVPPVALLSAGGPGALGAAAAVATGPPRSSGC